jgi:hypothetical protein
VAVTDDDGERPSRRRVRPESEPSVKRPSTKQPGGQWPMAERSLLPTVLGVRPYAAVGLGAALTAVGVLVDLTRIGTLGTVFTICHIAGCVLAVAWVRRDGLFGPMVQPPLLVAAAVPVVVLLAGDPRPGQGVADRLLVIGAPLVNAFPIMAGTTGAVLVLGFLRMFLQRPLDAPAPAPNPASAQRSGRGAARGAGRTSGSPRR